MSRWWKRRSTRRSTTTEPLFEREDYFTGHLTISEGIYLISYSTCCIPHVGDTSTNPGGYEPLPKNWIIV